VVPTRDLDLWMKLQSVALVRASPLWAAATLAIGLTLFPAGALADIHKCVDADGLITFTDSPSRKFKSCTLLYRDPGPAAAAPKPAPGDGSTPASRARVEPSPARTNPGPDNFPRVERSEQRDRDLKARQIVERELAGEQRLLEDARRQISALGTQPTDKSEPKLRELRDTVSRHERNIAEIQRQLSMMK